jgi:hypothetical protein
VGRIGRQIFPSGIGIVVCVFLCLSSWNWKKICPIGIVVFVFLCLLGIGRKICPIGIVSCVIPRQIYPIGIGIVSCLLV